MGSEKEMALADDKTKRAPQDAKLISLEEDYEVQYWTRKYGVTKQRLADGIKAVGPARVREQAP
jgi:hypothetical protein